MATAQVRVSAEDRRRQILERATELFARQGYQGTTTRQIAQRARVNEAIIFRHFPTKEDLYWAVLEHHCSTRDGMGELDARLRSGAGDEEILSWIARQILGRDTVLLRLLMFSALEHHKLSARFFKAHVSQYHDRLAEYIRQGIASKRFRSDLDPLLAARAFLGMVSNHFTVQELYGGKRFQVFDPEQVCREYTQIWLQGMRP
jgi:AcrR family transcriptional regulator